MAELVMVASYATGDSTVDLAKKFKTTPATVVVVLEEHGVIPRQGSNKPKWSAAQEYEALQAFDAGKTLAEIASYVSLSINQVSSLLRRNGRRMRIAGRRRAGYINTGGYRVVRVDIDDPMAVMGQDGHESSISRGVLEHRLVLARKLGRPLLEHETVHHKDGNPLNNSSKNLELRVGRHGRGASKRHCKTCNCFT